MIVGCCHESDLKSGIIYLISSYLILARIRGLDHIADSSRPGKYEDGNHDEDLPGSTEATISSS